ncbi:hypothetical protein ACVJBD_000075 [Rhizobium mongolense]
MQKPGQDARAIMVAWDCRSFVGCGHVLSQDGRKPSLARKLLFGFGDRLDFRGLLNHPHHLRRASGLVQHFRNTRLGKAVKERRIRRPVLPHVEVYRHSNLLGIGQPSLALVMLRLHAVEVGGGDERQ